MASYVSERYSRPRTPSPPLSDSCLAESPQRLARERVCGRETAADALTSQCSATKKTATTPATTRGTGEDSSSSVPRKQNKTQNSTRTRQLELRTVGARTPCSIVHHRGREGGKPADNAQTRCRVLVVFTPQHVRRAYYKQPRQCEDTAAHFFLPPEIFALIASASAFCFFICSFWAKEPSSSSSSSSFLPLAATSSKPGQQVGS